MQRIIGRLTRDAEIRSVGNEKTVVSFSLAVNDSYRRKDGERVQLTEFFNCSYWLGTAVAEYLTKGTIVELNGRISASAWMDQEGNPRASLEFNTSQIVLHGGKNREVTQGKGTKGGKPKGKQNQPSIAGTEDDLPF